MAYPFEKNEMLFLEARKVIPGGVNSPVRAFGSTGGTPLFIKRARGSLVYDHEGSSYIDFVGSWGPMILGHAHPEVVESIKRQAELSTGYGAPTELETKLAMKIIDMVPDIDKVRLTNSGTEACMTALRIARGHTGRDKFIKFEGCYHGHADPFLVKSGSGLATLGLPSSAGVTKGSTSDTLIAKFNNLQSVENLLNENSGEIAAIIVEPVAGNMGCIPPQKGFLEGLRTLCDKHGALLIFDEVMTGFRLARGGAGEYFKIRADLKCFGKIIGGGLPMGAVAGPAYIIDKLAPNGPVYQAGTLSGNPLAVAAGLTTLSILQQDNSIYQQLEQSTEAIAHVFISLNREGYPISCNKSGSMISPFFSFRRINNYSDVLHCDHQRFRNFFHHLLRNGIYIPPSPFESWFLATTHTDWLMEKTCKVIRKALIKSFENNKCNVK